jgi:hypothetical protein
MRDGQADATASSLGGRLMASYDTAGDSRFETLVDGSLALDWFDAELQLSQVADSSSALLDSQQVQGALQYCTAHPDDASCSPARVRALRDVAPWMQRPASTSLARVGLSAGVVETLYRDTDVGLSATCYLYTSDPTKIVGPGGGARGRGIVLDPAGGLALSPLRWSLRPELSHRIGRFSVGGWLQYGQYVAGADFTSTMAAGLRLAYRPHWWDERFRLWLTTTGQRDVDPTGASAWTETLAAGLRLSF